MTTRAKGHPKSPEHRAKMSESALRRWQRDSATRAAKAALAERLSEPPAPPEPIRVAPDEVERWAPVQGYEGVYEISTMGFVRRIGASSPLIGGQTHGGYRTVCLSMNGIVKTFSVHALIARTFLPPKPAGATINHMDGVKTNNRASNLEWLTQGDNTRHASRMGLMPHGATHHEARLNEDEIREIRRRYADTAVSQRHLAKEFGVTQRVIWQIVHYHTWAHVQ